jgi:acyl-CoA synthetase (AMP-forming)/AMP-acid ligase II
LVLYPYLKALEVCMVKRVNAKDLQIGDWLEEDVRIGKKTIRKTVHGLSFEDIAILKKARKKVLIKDGIPFTIAFLGALIFMGYVSVFLEPLLSRVSLF